MICASTHRLATRRAPRAQPGEDRQVVGVDPELAGRRRRGQGYLVQASRVARVRLSPTDAPEPSTVLASSRVSSRRVWALPSKPPHGPGQLVQRVLAVVAERRVAEVVGQRGGLRDVGLRAQRPGQVPRDLGDLEAVGEPVADEVVHLRPVHLGLGGQPPRGGRVHHAGPVALVRRPLGRLHPLGRLATSRSRSCSSYRSVLSISDRTLGCQRRSVDRHVHVVVVVRRSPSLGHRHRTASPRTRGPASRCAGAR